MLNRKYYPFERNHYYFGKLLTAKDFEAEQRYANDKRRLNNRLTGANGVVAGLDVIMADDASIILQAGCAYDASGREIVVPQTRVIKLSTIDGYSQLTTGSAFLGLQYAEQPADEAYSAMEGEEGGPAYNKVREQYTLTLLDENLAAPIPSPVEDFVERKVLYASRDVEVAQYAPRYVTRGADAAVYTEIRRLEAGTGEYSFVYQLESPGFVNQQGGSTTEIAINSLRLQFGEKQVIQTLLTPQPYVWGGSNTQLTIAGFTIRKNDETFTLRENLEMQLKPVDRELTAQYLATYYQKSMDKELSERYDERLWIARIRLIRKKTEAIIDAIEPAPFGQYCYNAQQLMALRTLEAYYPVAGAMRQTAAAGLAAGAPAHSAITEKSDRTRVTACGVFDFPLGMGGDARTPLFSDEIMHGLGKGPVYVTVGLEYVSADETKLSDSEIILGDASLFEQTARDTHEERVYQVSTAVKVLPERGTFIVGVKLGQPTGLISLRMRWYAMRMEETDKKLSARRDGERMILVNHDTIVLQPKETTHISPAFINMPGEACSYSVVEPEGGTVDNNGVYTAPAREGVYEIRIAAMSDPTVYTHVFAIVSAKKKEEAK